MSLAIDCIINPLQMMENRYILQNNIKEFRAFRKPVKLLRKAMFTGEAFRGMSFHFVNNTIGLFTRIPFYLSIISGSGLAPISYAVYLSG